jgi:amidohydrolase
MDIKKMAYDLKDKLIEMRRHLHQIPELADEEFKTSSYVAGKLSKLGIEVKTGIAKTGVVGILKGNGNKTIALRADMDALPLAEKNDVEYKSKHKGKMHACGHDAHMSILLGAAMLLSKIRKHLKGNVKFIFQPSEERVQRGAKTMIKEGVLNNPKVDAILGLHVDPTIPTGKIGYKPGVLMAFTSEFTIILKGFNF